MSATIETPVCDVEGCETAVPGLNDGYEMSRGVVCNDCIDYNSRHNHYPDEKREFCAECIVDNGGARHECEQSAAGSVIISPTGECPHCGRTADEERDA